jgi:hypothetical protein
MTCRASRFPAADDGTIRLAAERLVRRQLALVPRPARGLGLKQASWCRATFAHYIGLERAAIDLRRRAAQYRARPLTPAERGLLTRYASSLPQVTAP